MKTLFQASNALEAHMLADVLKQQGFTAHVQGEHLQGAAGEVPLAGLVHLTIDEDQFEAARRVVAAWEAAQPAAEPPSAVARAGKARPFGYLVLGLFFGVMLTFLVVRAPASTDGIDYNGDGKLDEIWTYSLRGTPTHWEADRNLDGKIDHKVDYDLRSEAKTAMSDDDFDGSFETSSTFRMGNVEAVQVDTDGDGHADLVSYYKHGVLESNEHRKPGVPGAYRVEWFRLGKLTHADLDSDGDGRLDTRIRYSSTHEAMSPEALKL